MPAVYLDRLILHPYRVIASFVSYKLLNLRMMVFACVLMSTMSVMAQSSATPVYKGTPHDEVQKSMGQRKWFEALKQIDDYLINQPRDPQMRFWRARLMQQMQRPEEALDIYIQLAQDYPELPEVQNNLGVMLASMGKLSEAKAAFEHALLNNPNYATAHENLGDVLLHLAKRSFITAQELGANSRALSTKLQDLDPVLQSTLSPP
jgi:Tfp pilus assembly protein PilF